MATEGGMLSNSQPGAHQSTFPKSLASPMFLRYMPLRADGSLLSSNMRSMIISAGMATAVMRRPAMRRCRPISGSGNAVHVQS